MTASHQPLSSININEMLLLYAEQADEIRTKTAALDHERQRLAKSEQANQSLLRQLEAARLRQSGGGGAPTGQSGGIADREGAERHAQNERAYATDQSARIAELEAALNDTQDAQAGAHAYERALITRLASMNDELVRARGLIARLARLNALSPSAAPRDTAN